ncbi:hypothetical protein IQ247_04685 [Plectonema cf. radiosum LEGE 06105]|uniref:Uncharacterized protein n=1 Tax=Plectonema cf. radiosum LEGE 06105 TaxID=945769 RepID=A0A8J7F2S1_9CYAN|nr:hypothetical protein [Plectonema radiosum]MBE9212015.1 hypothetical protein [Plectonema cf. radiosum LEGE 06105]
MTTFESNFYKKLAEKANQAVTSTPDSSDAIIPIQFGEKGDFNFYWEVQSGTFNSLTLDYINSLATPGGENSLKVHDSFSDAYVRLLDSISYSLDSKDKEKLSQATSDTNSEANALVTQYKTTVAPITDTDKKEAKDAGLDIYTDVDYVINYKFLYLWSGCKTQKKLPLSLDELNKARDLNSQFPMIPASAKPLVNLLAKWLNVNSEVLSLQDSVNRNNWILTQLKNYTEKPSKDNGGIETLLKDGTKKERIGYKINLAGNEIVNEIKNTSQKINISMSAKKLSEDAMNVSVEGSGEVNIPIVDFFSISGSGKAKYDMFSANGTSEGANIEITYPGFVRIPISPVEFQQDALKGWYYPKIIQEAKKNTDKDVSGFKFSPKSPYNLDKNGEFGRLTNLLISNYPTIKITYYKGDYNKFKESLSQSSEWNVKFLCFPLGRASESIYSTKLEENSQDGSFSVTFSPPTNNLTVPDLEKVAYVIGGAVEYPAS